MQNLKNKAQLQNLNKFYFVLNKNGEPKRFAVFLLFVFIRCFIRDVRARARDRARDCDRDRDGGDDGRARRAFAPTSNFCARKLRLQVPFQWWRGK